MWFFIIAYNKANPVNLSQLPGYPLSIAASSHYQGIRVSAVRHSEQAAGFAICNMSNRAGVEYIDIGLIQPGYHPVPCLSKLFGQKLCLGLIQLAT